MAVLKLAIARTTRCTQVPIVEALAALGACLPSTWGWRSVPGLRIMVLDPYGSSMVVTVEGSDYVAAQIPNGACVTIGKLGRPGAAAEVLTRPSTWEADEEHGFAGGLA